MRNSLVNYIFFAMIGFIILIIIISNTQAKNQNEVFLDDFKTYSTALNLLSEEDYERSKNMLTQLYDKYPDNYTISYSLAKAYVMLDDYQEAARLYEEAIEKFPFFQLDPDYCSEYGKTLLQLNEKEKGKAYLLKARELFTEFGQEKEANEITKVLNSI
ncbi:tetratricopeptide repeat protein [Bacillus sp. Marseille-P3661]|uniref:tetratricopeptide repeat protein n=1 Tax=Bacillus sp. Marseille-P3661 TaxID=1936234 RepID=UPI000C838054|nr:tetratricopeptide repeat protein [Bacillus sp. Marseille-P3661]